MNNNSIRDIMRNSKNTTSYESRSSINRKNKVNQIIGNISNGLAGAEDELMNKASIDKLVDKYYSADESPSADAITEMMGNWEHPNCKIVIVGAMLFLGSLFLYCRR
jgi:hypothetical protein